MREIQERRARDATLEAEEKARRRTEQPAALETNAPQLGLVPTPETPEINPIVAAALKRLERARQAAPPMPRPRATLRGGTAAATARIADERYDQEVNPVTAQAANTPASVPASVTAPTASPEVSTQPKTSAEGAKERNLMIVPAQPAATKVTETKVIATPAPNKQRSAPIVPPVIEEESPVVSEPESTDAIFEEDFYDDRAPVTARVAGSLIDLLVVAFASSPFAAIIELTNGNWTDWRVDASMGGIMLVIMFLYLTAATALAGRTWGMRLLSLRAVDADTGLPPTTKQAVGRALLYLFSLITLGLGIIYALFDPEGRTAHDHLSGTAVVRD